jgi:hypothetical protein
MRVDFGVKCAIRKNKQNQERPKFNEVRKRFVIADHFNLVGYNVNAKKMHTHVRASTHTLSFSLSASVVTRSRYVRAVLSTECPICHNMNVWLSCHKNSRYVTTRMCHCLITRMPDMSQNGRVIVFSTECPICHNMNVWLSYHQNARYVTKLTCNCLITRMPDMS